MKELEERLRALVERQRNERGDYLDKGRADPEIEQAADTLKRYREALEAWEAWEAKWLLDDRAWDAEDPKVPCDLHDEYVTGPQAKRALALQESTQ